MTKPKFLNDKDPWMLAEEIPDVDFFFSQIWVSGFSDQFAKPVGRAYKKILSIHRGYHLWFFYGEQDSKEVGEYIAKRFINEPKFVKKVNQEIVTHSDELRSFAEKLPIVGLSKYSNEKLWNIHKKHDQLHTIFYQWGWIPVGADMFHNNFTEKVKQYLRGIDVPENKINEYLVILTQPTKKSLIQIEQEEFLKIFAKIQQDSYHSKLFKTNLGQVKKGIKKNIYNLVDQYHQKYLYVARMWIGKPSTLDHYLSELIKISKSGVNAKKLLKVNRAGLKKEVQKRQALIKKLKITGKWRVIFDGFGDFMVTKIYRRYSQLYALYKMEFILKEIAKRLNLTLKQVRFMLPEEVEQALLKNKLNKEAIKQRTKYCVYYVEKGIDKLFVGNQAKALAKKTARQLDDVAELKGQTGCIGKATGTVRIVIRPKDMAKMKKGDILVSIATDPDIVSAMKKAAAIVTEQGGVTSHAAIVSRELGIPCLIGTKIATKIFKDGDQVEVDATKGIVKKI